MTFKQFLRTMTEHADLGAVTNLDEHRGIPGRTYADGFDLYWMEYADGLWSTLSFSDPDPNKVAVHIFSNEIEAVA